MLKRTLILIATLLTVFATPAVAQSDQPVADRKKVGLVLSGGGAKGIAHIGVLKVLEQAGIPIDYIAGTSMGAIIGGLYSVGYTPAELDSLVRNRDWLALLSDRVERQDKLFREKLNSDIYIYSFPISPERKISLPGGFLAGQNVHNLLNDLMIGYQNMDSFDDLPIPFACVSYDMTVGRDYVARSGNLPLAIRASMSIPGAFTPVDLDGMLLIDGGVSNNFPVNVARDMGAEVIIGVDLFAGLKSAEQLNNMMGMVDQITTFLGRDNYQSNLSDVDLYLHPDIHPYNAASFNPQAVDSLLVRGERVALHNWDKIVALKKTIGIDDQYVVPERKNHLADSDSLRIGTISFEGLGEQERGRVRRYLALQDNSVISKKELNDAISRLRGSGSFSYVTYNLQNQPPYNLVVSVDEKNQSVINLGFRFDTQQMASILLNTTFGLRGGIFSPTVSLSARLSQNPYARVGISTGRLGFGRLGASYAYRYNDFSFYNDGVRANSVVYGQHSASVAFSDIYLRYFNCSVGLNYQYFNYRTFLYANQTKVDVVEAQGYLNYFADLHYESFDDIYYPTHGHSLKAKYTLHTEDGFTVDEGSPFSSVSYEFKGAYSFSDRLTVVPSFFGRTLIGRNAKFPYFNVMGGIFEGRYVEQQIPFVGITHSQIFDNSVLALGVDLRARFWKRHYLTAKLNYAIQDNYFLDMFYFENQLWGYGLEYSYQTPVGPLTVLFSGTSRNFAGIYISFGKNF